MCMSTVYLYMYVFDGAAMAATENIKYSTLYCRFGLPSPSYQSRKQQYANKDGIHFTTNSGRLPTKNQKKFQANLRLSNGKSSDENVVKLVMLGRIEPKWLQHIESKCVNFILVYTVDGTRVCFRILF